MVPSPDIAGFTDQLVADCALDCASVFFYDGNAGRPRLSYLYHVGVSHEAQHRYEAGRVFEADPFTRSLLAQGNQAQGGFVHWGDADLNPFVARTYTSFLDHYAFEVVGAHTRELAPDLCLVIGTLCKAGTSSRRVHVPLLRQRLQALSGMVLERFVASLIASPTGRLAASATLGHIPYLTGNLSQREAELAALICQGLQNKAIAFEMRLSEHTVENYLRRLYLKLGVRNRAGLVSRMTQCLH